MNFRKEQKEETVKNRSILFTFSVFFLFSINSYAQDSILAAKDLTEEKELNFQQFFFKALSEKSIGNYQVAIQNLESCNQILPDDVAVFFEFSKNYLLLNNTLLAKEYIIRALKNEVNNIWMQKHLVKIYVKDSNFGEAIRIQKKITAINLKEKSYLIRLYFQNKQYEKAYALINILERENGLPIGLKRLKSNLEKRKEQPLINKNTGNLPSQEEKFKTDKSYQILEQILKKSIDNPESLLKYSKEGIDLFPAQPLVYLMNGKALNFQKNYTKALTILKNGIDFVIEDTMEAAFYQEIAIAYKGLGNLKEEKKYLEKSKKLKS